MNTTNVFVEIGQFLDASTSSALLLPMLASTCILGIVLDRLANRVFKGPAA